MELFQALLLGAVQGLTEFLPISSSGHLILVPYLLGWGPHSLAFDVAVHLGTAGALLGFFWRDWVQLALAFGRGVLDSRARGDFHWKLIWLLVVGSLPAGLVGLAFESQIEALLRQPQQVASLLLVGGLAMGIIDRYSARQRGLERLGVWDAFLIGAAQMLALAPGLSRSAATISAALLLGLQRQDAARFSFLLGTPIIVAAGLYKLAQMLSASVPSDELGLVVGGMLAAFLAGILSIGFLLRLLERHSLAMFVGYRVAVGAAVLLMLLLGT